MPVTSLGVRPTIAEPDEAAGPIVPPPVRAVISACSTATSPPIVIAFLDRDEPTPGTRDMIERSEAFGCVVVIIDVRLGLGKAVALMEQNLAKLDPPVSSL